jgi:hypothetical protein
MNEESTNMRMLLKMTVPVERGNETIIDGSLPRKLQAIMADLKPEAAYFLTMDGQRTALVVFDLQDPSQIPTIAEPFFIGFDADVELYPVMTAEDLAKGLGPAMEAVKKYG